MNPAQFKAALSRVKHAVSVKADSPAFSSYFFLDDRVCAYNGALAVSAPCPIGLNGFGVRARTLSDWAGSCSGEDVGATMVRNNSRVQFRSGRSTVALAFVGTDLFQFTPPPTDENRAVFGPEIKAGLLRCSIAMEAQDARFWQSGMTIQASGGLARCFASDNRSLAYQEIELGVPMAAGAQVLCSLSPDFVMALNAICKNDLLTELVVSRLGSSATFESGAYLYGAALESKPETLSQYEATLSRMCLEAGEMIALPTGLLKSVQRASVVLSGMTVQMVNLTVGVGQMVVSATADGAGDARDELHIGATMPCSIAIEASRIKDALPFSDRMAVLDNRGLVLEGPDRFLFVVAAISN